MPHATAELLTLPVRYEPELGAGLPADSGKPVGSGAGCFSMLIEQFPLLS